METELTIDQEIDNLSNEIYDTLDKCREGLDKLEELRNKLGLSYNYLFSQTVTLDGKNIPVTFSKDYYTKLLYIHENIINSYMDTIVRDSYDHSKTI